MVALALPARSIPIAPANAPAMPRIPAIISRIPSADTATSYLTVLVEKPARLPARLSTFRLWIKPGRLTLIPKPIHSFPDKALPLIVILFIVWEKSLSEIFQHTVIFLSGHYLSFLLRVRIVP